MGAYIIRRLLSGVVMIFAVTLVTFAVFRLIPQVPACLVVPCGPHTVTTSAQIAAVNHRLGVDKPLPVQYGDFVWRIFRHGSFGGSWAGFSIDSVLRASLPPTISILVGGVVLLILLAVPLAVLSALRAQTVVDRAVLFFAIFGIALHPFVIGLGLKTAFATHLHLAPSFRAYFMGLWSVLVGVFLLSAATSVVRSVRNPTTVRDAMSPPIAVEPDWPISKLIDEVLPLHRQASFPVALNRRLLGILSLEDVKKIPRDKWRSRRIRDAMRTVNSRLFVSENATIESVNELMAHNGVGAVGVVDGTGELVGFLRRGTLKARKR